MTFKETLTERFACKAFSDKQIPRSDLDFILEAGRLAPSSFGYEPWKFIVLTKKEDNQALSKLCWNQENVATANVNIVVVARTDLQSKDEFARKQVRRFAKDEAHFEKTLKIYTSGTDAMNEVELYEYAAKNCYLAAMQMATAAMTLGIDSCLIGGFEKDKVDTFLELPKHFGVAIILSLGYRKEHSKHTKKRLSIEEVVEYY